jgi:hypothetical protein
MITPRYRGLLVVLRFRRVGGVAGILFGQAAPSTANSAPNLNQLILSEIDRNQKIGFRGFQIKIPTATLVKLPA